MVQVTHESMISSVRCHLAACGNSRGKRLLRHVSVICAALLSFSCGGKDSDKDAQDAAPDAAPEETEKEVRKGDGTEFLTEPSIAQVLRQTALVRIPGQGDVPGLLANRGRRNGVKEYLVFCSAAVSESTERAIVVFTSSIGLQKAYAQKVATLPSGVTMYAFSSLLDLHGQTPYVPAERELYHVLKIQAGTEVTQEAISLEKSQLAETRAQIASGIAATKEANRNASNVRPDTILRDLELKASHLEAGIEFPCAALVAQQMVAAASLDYLQSSYPSKEPTLQVTSALAIRALRHDGNWLTLKELLESIPLKIENVSLRLTGSSDYVDVNCTFNTSPGASDKGLSMVAATTFEMENVGTGSVSERLSQMEAVPFQNSYDSKSSARRTVKWGGRKSTLWLRIVKNNDHANPLLEESIQIETGDRRCVFHWAKPPSDKIVITPPEPDSPLTLVKERKVLDAKGPIRDLVVAGDGSTLLVQTLAPPFWSQLDLKSGDWIRPAWKTDADTLIAAQADKLYLVNRVTKIVEIRNLQSGERLGMQLLPIDGELLSIAAPLKRADRPLLALTNQNAYLIDPVKFEIFRDRFDIAGEQSNDKLSDRDFEGLAPSTIVARVSDDGSLYGICGFSSTGSDNRPVRHVAFVDPVGLIVNRSTRDGWLAAKGREISREVPDHSGVGDYRIRSDSNNTFPGPPGSITFFKGGDNGSSVAVLNDPPLIPSSGERFREGPVMDRSVYFDSLQGLLLFPSADKLHFLRLDLPASPKVVPAFCYSGEEIEIPLSTGSGHRVESSRGGDIAIVGDTAKWTVPDLKGETSSTVTIRRDWVGDLGSDIGDVHQTQIFGNTPSPVAQVPRAGGKIEMLKLPLRTTISTRLGEFQGMAGSGKVALYKDYHEHRAVHLTTGEVIFHQKSKNTRKFIGDADQLYMFGSDGSLVSYDLNTGNKRAEVMLGSQIQDISTGMSSAFPLITVEMEKAVPFLSFIRRDTLRSVISNFPEETQRRFFGVDFGVNASGTLAWGRNTAILRDDKVVTLKPYEDTFSGTPDASGRFLVSSRSIMDLSSNPPREVEISSLPGVDDSSTCELDESGRYLCITRSGSPDNPYSLVGSFRDIQNASKELFAVTYSSDRTRARFVSGTKTLFLRTATRDGSVLRVYEFDIAAFAGESSP